MTVENVSSTSTRSLEELLVSNAASISCIIAVSESMSKIPSSDDGERRRLDPDETWAVVCNGETCLCAVDLLEG